MAIDQFDSAVPVVPRWRNLTVVAQDPSIRWDGTVVVAEARIPYERLEPGPHGHRFHVVDYDTATRSLTPPRPFAGDVISGAPGEDLAAPARRAQNVYAIAARTLAAFEEALGRRVPWSFGSHQLYILPAAIPEANAFYDPDHQALLFGYVDVLDEAGAEYRVHTSLSHDIVAHETTHAVLDGMRRRFEEPGLPDQAAFHEALADIVALLSVFSLPRVPERLLGRADAEGRIDAAAVSPAAIRASALFGLGEEFGAATGRRGEALRRSIDLDPTTDRLADHEEPHRRGEFLVASVVGSLLDIWSARLETLHQRKEPVDLVRAAEEGAKSAEHLLRMCIRAIDYTPSVELEFGDFLDAILAADETVVPNDDHGYRASLIRSFGAFGIVAPPRTVIPATGRSRGPRYDNLHLEELRVRRDEVFRFIWENGDILALPLDIYLVVDDVQSCARVGPDGFVVLQTVATYTQMLEGTAAELTAYAVRRGGRLDIPTGVGPETRIQLLGGGALVFDEFGRLSWHQRKRLLDWDRQSARLAYLTRNRFFDNRGRLGFSLGTPEGQRFALVHAVMDDVEEIW
jgi:hypothetical protein